MTAIGMYCGSAGPILIGDLALSALGPATPTELPTRHAQTRRGDSGRVITNLTQKVAVIGEGLAVAWAGSPYVAKQVLEELRSRYAEVDPDAEDLARVLEALELGAIAQDFHLLASFRTPMGFGSLAMRQQKCTLFERVHTATCGSGADVLRMHIDAMLGAQAPSLISEDPVLYDIACATTVASAMMAHEIAAPDLLLESFGGGYETVCADTNGFYKAEYACHMFCDVRVGDLGSPFFPTRILRPYYLGDVLVVQGADISPDGDFVGEASHAVTPMYRRSSDALLREAMRVEGRRSYTAEVLVLHLIVRQSSGFVIASGLDIGGQKLRLIDKPGGLEIGIHDNCMRELRTLAQQNLTRVAQP